MRFLLATLLLVLAGCGPAASSPRVSPLATKVERLSGPQFLDAVTRKWPKPEGPYALAVSRLEGRATVAIYDNALIALVALRRGKRDLAAQILASLAELQAEDGSLPFSFAWPAPDAGDAYVRTGAVAWVGYAAVEYIDSGREGLYREAIVAMAHKIAEFILTRQIADAQDARNGLVTGGFGRYRYEVVRGQIQEIFVPGPILWASVEHNVDAYFFLRSFGRLIENKRYTAAAERIGEALVARAWDERRGQLVRGITSEGPDPAFALDCASWGSLFLIAAGEKIRAETAMAVADGRFGTRDGKNGTFGHRPYAHLEIFEQHGLAESFLQLVPERNWNEMYAVWTEGSAGVALAAARLGHRARAERILAELEPLRGPHGGFPEFTRAVPLQFTKVESVGGTAWVELVKAELKRQDGDGIFWFFK